MSFKLDENLDPRLTTLFEHAGHEADSVSGEGLSGEQDEVIFQESRRMKRTFVTLDLDFSNPFRFPPASGFGTIVLRPARPTLPMIRNLIENLIPILGIRKVHGKLWIVEPGRIREYEPEEKV